MSSYFESTACVASNESTACVESEEAAVTMGENTEGQQRAKVHAYPLRLLISYHGALIHDMLFTIYYFTILSAFFKQRSSFTVF